MRYLSVILLVLCVSGAVAAERSAGGEQPVDALLRALKRTQDPRQAEQLREKVQKAWIAAGPMSAQVLLKEAARAQAAGLRQTAERLLRLAARRWPEYAEARYRLAFFLWQTQRTEAALRQLEALLAQHPDHFPALTLRVRLLLELQRERQALKACQMLLERFPAWRRMQRRCERLRRRLEEDV